MGLIAFVGVGVAGIVYLWRSKGQATRASAFPVISSAAAHGSRAAWTFSLRSQTGRPLVGNRGWLLLYMVGLVAELVHSLVLTVGSLVIYADPSVAGLRSFIPLWALLVYVLGNLGLLAYGVALLVLMQSKRKAAIANNILFNALTVTFLVSWFLLGAKSPFGTVVDSLPALAGIAYFLRSRRVRNTYTAS